MGSGKGKTRRSQGIILDSSSSASTPTSGPAPSTPLRLAHSRWQEFVEDQGIGGVKVFDYYCVSVPPGGKGAVSEREIEAVAKELFRDLVAVDAVTLPSGVGVDDFCLEVRNIASALVAYETPCLVLRNTKTGAEETCFSVWANGLTGGAKIDGPAVLDMSFDICHAMRKIYNL